MYRPIVRTKKEMLYILIQALGPITCEQLESNTGWRHQTVSARIAELTTAGRVRVSGTTRVSSGRDARTYTAR